MTARARLWLDLALFGALFLAYNPAWTRIAVHEWLSVVTIVPLLFHVIVNWDQTLADPAPLRRDACARRPRSTWWSTRRSSSPP